MPNPAETVIDAKFKIGDLVEIVSTQPANALLKGRLALVQSAAHTVDLGAGQSNNVYAVKIAGLTADATIIAYESELAPAPASDRYDDDKITGDVIAKRFNDVCGIFAVELLTGEVVVKTKSRS